MSTEHAYDNGDKYNGVMTGGKRNGKGVYSTSDGLKFDGSWNNDAMNGMGVYEGTDGKYEGEWKESLKHGKGSFSWTEGDRYVGEWVEDQMNGAGQFFWGNGKSYDGEWMDGLRDGMGLLKFPNGSHYKGQWKNDKCEGYGEFVEDNGQYHGQWQDNKKHGHGVYQYKDGRIYDGEWINDKKTKGYVAMPDGTVFKVTFNDKGEVIDQTEASIDDLPSKKRSAQPATAKKNDGERWPVLRHVDAPAGSGSTGPRLRIEGENVGSAVKDWESGDVGKKRVVDPNQVRPFKDPLSYAELKMPGSKWQRPAIDAAQRELYLSDKEFQQYFGVTKDGYKQLPKWKQNMKKKETGLF